MTEREYYEEIIKQLKDDELQSFCQKKIDAIDAKARKARERSAARRAEGDAMTDTIKAYLPRYFTTIADLLVMIGDESITVGKAQYRLNQLVEQGIVEKTDMTLETASGKVTRKGYRLADQD